MAKNILEFREILKASLFLTEKSDIELFDRIPESILERLFLKNFNGNIELARNILLNDFDSIDRSDLDEAISEIVNRQKSLEAIKDYIDSGKKIVFITDIDNDGSLGQAIIQNFTDALGERADNISVIYSKIYPENPTRGFNLETVDEFFTDNEMHQEEDILIVTVDNGVNSRVEQERIIEKYKNLTLLVTDHHLPNEDDVIIDGGRTILYNPQCQPNEYFKGKNISGAHTIQTLLSTLLENEYYDTSFEPDKYLGRMEELAYISNMLDYVSSDIRHKPLVLEEITKYANMGVMLNANNSLDKIITGQIDTSVIDDLVKEYPDMDQDLIMDRCRLIRQLNVYAYKLLKLNRMAKESPEIYSDSQMLYNLIVREMTDFESNFEEGINNNYVSKLRPIILGYGVNPDKNSFQSELAEVMLDVFKKLKNAERDIMDQFRSHELLNTLEQEYSRILYPKNANLTSVFNRKFLFKTYNYENSGFLFFVDHVSDTEARGSFRSKYSIHKILKKKYEIENELGVQIKVMGHHVAAGMFVTAKDGQKLDPNALVRLNQYINDQIAELSMKEKLSPKEYILGDFESLALFDKINQKIRANVANTESLPVLVKVTKDTYFTDNKTTEQVGVGSILKDKKFGYVPIKLDFHGSVLILQTETLRASAKNNYASYLSTSYMNESAFIVNGIEHNLNPKLVHRFDGAKKERENLLAAFKHLYLKNPSNLLDDSNFEIALSNEDLMDIPYFKNAINGEDDFRAVESLIIEVLDATGQDIYSICDVEATGLGKSPKLTNIGFFNFKIDQLSGKKITAKEYRAGEYSSVDGIRYYLTRGQRASLVDIDEVEYPQLIKSGAMVLVRDGRKFLAEDMSPLKIHNLKDEGDRVLINRNLVADCIAMLIKDSDMHVTPELAKLTNIDNRMINAAGIPSRVADQILVNKLKDKKILVQTHNGLSYDGNVVGSNLKESSKIYFSSPQIDSILYSRGNLLAYDETKVIEFAIPEMKNKFFYCDEYSRVSLVNFLKSSVLREYHGFNEKYKLKSDGDSLYFVNNETAEEFLLSMSKTEALEYVEQAMLISKANDNPHLDIEIESRKPKAVLKDIPATYRKFGVVAISEQKNIMNMLQSIQKEVQYIDVPDDLKEHEGMFTEFMVYYDFSHSLAKNINNFIKSVTDPNQVDFIIENYYSLFEFGEEFLKTNIEVHEQYRDLWIAKRILKNHSDGEDPSEDYISLLAWKTGFDDETVARVLDSARVYMDMFGLDYVFNEEQHNNIIPNEGYLKGTEFEGLHGVKEGDVALEGALTLTTLISKTSNPYSKMSKTPTNIVLETLQESTARALRGEAFSVNLNSLSTRQANAYTRRGLSEKIKNAKNPEEHSFKLKEDILPSGTAIYCDIDHVELERLDLMETTQKVQDLVISKIVRNTLLTQAEKIDRNVAHAVTDILEENVEADAELEAELSQKLGLMFFSRKYSESKGVFETIYKTICDEDCKTKFPKYLSDGDKRVFYDFIDKIEEFHNNIGLDGNYEAARSFVSRIESFQPQFEDDGHGFVVDTFKMPKTFSKFMVNKGFDKFRPLLQRVLDFNPEKPKMGLKTHESRKAKA